MVGEDDASRGLLLRSCSCSHSSQPASPEALVQLLHLLRGHNLIPIYAMNPSFVVHIPGEIWDRVIDHLHNDCAALDSCALVCSAWVASARLHRFHSLNIRWNPQKENSAKASVFQLLCDLSSSAPLYVRSLCLEEPNGRRMAVSGFMNMMLLRMRCNDMTSLRSLVLRYPDYHLMSSHVRACLMRLFTSLEHLALVSPRMKIVRPVLALLCAAPALRSLDLRGAPFMYIESTMGKTDVGTLGWTVGPHNLQTLWVSGAHRWYPFLQEMTSFGLHTRLRHIHVDEIYSVTGLAAFIRLVAVTLESLSLTFPRDVATDIYIGSNGGVFAHCLPLDSLSKLITEDFLGTLVLTECRVLQKLSLACSLSLIIPFLAQLVSPYIKQITIDVFPVEYNMHDLDDLRHLFSTTFASATLVVLGSDREWQSIASLQQTLLRDLPQLHAERRLRFVAHGPDDATPCAYYDHRGERCRHCRPSN
jgi:hypothetical protein